MLPGGPPKAHILAATSILYGYFGLDRFYQGQVAWGTIKLLTLGGFLVWWLIDAAYYTYKAAETWGA
ncbi:MAG: TM2 domain-containing protein [Chloroflexi bacterium]|nr:TM2 domain-containing protein [Chloroflexota bacterium]